MGEEHGIGGAIGVTGTRKVCIVQVRCGRRDSSGGNGVPGLCGGCGETCW